MYTKWIIGLIAAVVIVGSGIAVSRNQSVEKDATAEKARMAQKETVMEKKEAEVTEKKNADTMEKTPDTTMEKKGMYKDYSPQALTNAQKDSGKMVLFFHAKWCPFCKTADAAFLSRTNEIPSGITVLKTDYDSEKELKTKYGVTYQHTFVQVDAEGNLITKWNGGDIDALKTNIK